MSRNRELGGIQLRLRCDSILALVYVELMPFQANTFLSCYQYAEPESPVHSQATLAEQRRRRDLESLPQS